MHDVAIDDPGLLWLALLDPRAFEIELRLLLIATELVWSQGDASGSGGSL